MFSSGSCAQFIKERSSVLSLCPSTMTMTRWPLFSPNPRMESSAVNGLDPVLRTLTSAYLRNTSGTETSPLFSIVSDDMFCVLAGTSNMESAKRRAVTSYASRVLTPPSPAPPESSTGL